MDVVIREGVVVTLRGFYIRIWQDQLAELVRGHHNLAEIFA